MPQPELLDKRYQELQVPKSDADTYKDILVKLNDKITNSDEKKRQYRDKQVGHSYFWNIENDNDLRLVIKYQIIPLLQDYFYDDYAEIKGILGDEIITKENRQSDLLDKGNEAKLKNALLKALNPSKNTEQKKSTKDTEKVEVDDD
jgi:5-methylcytosine-specific restriction protein B